MKKILKSVYMFFMKPIIFLIRKLEIDIYKLNHKIKKFNINLNFTLNKIKFN
jgi:S-adenosylmethionine hydrolase